MDVVEFSTLMKMMYELKADPLTVLGVESNLQSGLGQNLMKQKPSNSEYMWCDKRGQRLHLSVCEKIQPCWRRKKQQCEAYKQKQDKGGYAT